MRSRGEMVLYLLGTVCFALATWGLGLAEDGNETGTIGNILIEHWPVKEHLEEKGVPIYVRLKGETPPYPIEVRLFYRVENEPFQSIPLEVSKESLQTLIPPQPRGIHVFYYLEAKDQEGRRTTLPAQADTGHLYRVKFKGHAPIPLLVGHIGAMFIGALLFLLGAIYYGAYLQKGVRFERISMSVAWGTLLIFIGGFSLGMAMGYAVFGKPWTGLPIGGDVTDTKTLIGFII